MTVKEAIIYVEMCVGGKNAGLIYNGFCLLSHLLNLFSILTCSC